ncbi:ribosomal RNA small subunit methyltransferase H [Polynucleobacter sp. SHI8]|uniref:16S rRNA (cytosine(1402)-N(4))-methyltransferase RsmH n=1 Tax=unclassified Polynucleobacter TaxID=2640945 RepID=UPI0024939EF9|nr:MULTISPECIES: 16S rRNA (cytosine(1402)-N(4))-methyltransferase RsmH [unclassified Polynucleobacter]BDW10091.1 ribosomal RNA small subunit methyltransferase H [Polynucleobacter sp. SHI2]BDW12537.1 ribosomal RNA small subunit methyltransferase H [Polynucleobacter sp. SHI8]
MTTSHRPVLLDEAVSALLGEVPKQHAFYLDGTFGRGGHSRLILEKMTLDSQLIACDKDPQAIAEAKQIQDQRFQIVHTSFANMSSLTSANTLDGILLDLGISSPQIDQAERGFSFRMDGPLDMRMNSQEGLSAQEWLATADEKNIAKVIKDYGEERFAVQIAKAIVASREQGIHIGTTRQLATLVASVVRTREYDQDPATRTFQAIRIFINQELRDLEEGLKMSIQLLKPEGRLVVISFHSLEDRMVKQFMQQNSKVDVPRGMPLRESEIPKSPLKILGRVKPTAVEIKQNPRARSAVMRIAEKVGL